jgi:hypothetical protein
MREADPTRSVVDKSLPVNELENGLGKAFHPQTIALEVDEVPNSAPTSGQVSAESALSSAAPSPNPRTNISHLPSRLRSSARASSPETSKENSVANRKNIFRATLDALADIEEKYGSKRADFFRRLPLTLKARFSESKGHTTTELLRDVAPNSPSDSIDTNLYPLLKHGVRDGWILEEENGAAGAGRTPVAFDLSEHGPFFQETHLGDVLAAYLASATSSTAKNAAVAAVRYLLGLPAHSKRAEIVDAAKATSCRVFHGLADRFLHDCLEAGEVDRKTAQNHASSLRSVINFGLTHDRFPLYFPEWRSLDSYRSAIDAAFPLASVGLTERTVLQVRSGLYLIADVIRDELGIPAIGLVTVENATEAIERLHSPRRACEYERVKSVRKLIGKAPGNWGLAELQPILSSLVATRRLPALPYLTSPNTPGWSRGIEPLVALFAETGLPSAWSEFVVWYREYSLLSDDQILDNYQRFPDRHPRRLLTEGTFCARQQSLRGYLGVAIHEFDEQPDTLTPERLFGELFVPLTRKIRVLWNRQVGQAVSHEASMGLHHIVYSAGLMALALYERSVHSRKLKVAMRPKLSGDEGIDYLQEEIALDRTPLERELFASYRHAQVLCAQFKASRMKNSPQGSGNTVKMLAEVIANTPSEMLVAVQDELLQKVRPLTKLTRPPSLSERSLIVATFFHGLLLSGGLRRGETTVLRLGIHVHPFLIADSPNRLRRQDRKNKREHFFCFREAYTPAWFLEYYRDVVHPLLLKFGGLENEPHPWLLLSPRDGRPYLNADEGEDGENRNNFKKRDREARLVTLWKRHVVAACTERGLELPEDAMITPHCVRNVLGNEVYQREGAARSATFLGDSEASVRGVYGMQDGSQVDISSVLSARWKEKRSDE